MGRSRVLRILCVLAGLVPFSALAETVYDLYGAARVLDPIHDIYSRAQVTGAYRSPFGTQVHPACFELAAKWKRASRPQVEKSFEELIRKSTEKMLSCGERYPELTPYVGDWISHVRRAVILCPEEGIQGTSAQNVMAPAYGVLRFGSALSGVNDLGFLESTARNYSSLYLFFPAAVKRIAEGASSPFDVDTLIHEAGHDTGINNTSVSHNSVERIEMTDESPCEVNAADDRATIFSSLCSGYMWSEKFSGRKVEQLLSDRIGRCGMRRGCVQLFTDPGVDFPVARYYMKSEPLPETEATRLCTRIQEEGSCWTKVAKDGPALTRASPVLEELGKRFSERFDRILPRYHNDVPAALLEAMPAVKRGMESLAETACFKHVFTKGADGTLFLRERADQGQRPREDRLKSAFRNLDSGRIREGKCVSTEEGKALGALVTLLRETLYCFGEAAPISKTMIGLRVFQGGAEMYDKLPLTNDKGEECNKLARDLLGSELVDTYLAALKKHHHLSPDFDCVAAGLKPKSAVANLLSILDPKEASCRAR